MSTITGTAGNDAVTGSTSADEIYGGDGNDTITGGSGNDVIYGGKGTDTVSYSGAFANFKLTALYEGKNSAFSGYTVADSIGSEGTDTTSSDVEYLSFSSGSTVYKVDSGTLTLVVNTVGTVANDALAGTTGSDTLDGGAGTDTVTWARASSNYQLTSTGTGWKVTDKTGVDGADTLTNVEKLQFSDRAVIIESQSHASYASLPSELYQFFITAFNAAPGVTYMDQLAEAYNYGMTVEEIVNVFTTKSQFTDVYATTLSHEALGTKLINNIVKNSATTAAKLEGAADIKGALDYGWSVGKVIFTVFGNLAKKSLTDSTWGGTAQQFNNEIAVAKYYTEVLNQSTTDLETLRDVIQPVTQSTSVSSDAVVTELIGVALITGGTGV